jgi:hypothetical protein
MTSASSMAAGSEADGNAQDSPSESNEEESLADPQQSIPKEPSGGLSSHNANTIQSSIPSVVCASPAPALRAM